MITARRLHRELTQQRPVEIRKLEEGRVGGHVKKILRMTISPYDNTGQSSALMPP